MSGGGEATWNQTEKNVLKVGHLAGKTKFVNRGYGQKMRELENKTYQA